MGKPELGFYRQVLDYINLFGNHVVFIDDKEESQVGPIVNIYSFLTKCGKVIELTLNTSNGKVCKHLLTHIW